jgi:hypothetical protein
MSNTPARIPFSLLPVGAPTGNAPSASASDVNRELQRIQRQQTGLFQPRVLVHGMGGDPSPYIVRGTDWLILADATAGAISIVFPDAARLDGLRVTVVKTDSSTNAVTLTGTFSGLTNPTLAAQYRAKQIDAGNGVWYFTPELAMADIADYATGTWTPTVTFGGGSTGVTYSTQQGSYTRIGNRVVAQCNIALSSKGTSTGTLLVNGLPFTVLHATPMMVWAEGLTGISGMLECFATGGTTNVRLYYLGTGAITQLTDANVVGSGTSLLLSAVYDI